MKKSLMMMLCLLCVASLVAGMAYTSAGVDTDSKITLSAADDALLAFDMGDASDKDKTVDIKEGKVIMNFDNEGHGIQPNGLYVWDDCIKVTNNSKNTVEFYVNRKANEEFTKQIQSGMRYDLYRDDNGKRTYLYSTNEDVGKIKLAAGEACKLSVYIGCNGNVDPEKDINAKLRFSADRISK